ncbi:hypothetical protein [Baekduia sp.]|uniref:hypothetical protein n=1 Tax=Baekduia sp. TaxID=2600305 RepID=UPI002E04DD72|nr:hypothetical protein [Baekduia sp.]
MTRRPYALALLLVGFGLLTSSAAAQVQAPVRLAARFSDEARLGRSTAVDIDLSIDHRLPRVTEVRLLTPSGMTLADSRLGIVPCRRPAFEFVNVLNAVVHGRCPANSLIGKGSATAGLLLNEDAPLFGAAFIELHAGPSVGDKPGLLISADTYNPARMQLTYAGYLYVPPAAFGLGLAIEIPSFANLPFDSEIALSDFHLVVGSPSITYNKVVHGRRVTYHPGGIPLPDRCPRRGFRLRAIVRFADGTRRTADATVPCPPARKAAGAA